MTCAVILPAFSLKPFDGFDCKDNTEEEGHLGVKGRINHKSERYGVTSYSTRRFLRPVKSTLVIRVMLFLSRSLERKKKKKERERGWRKKLKAFHFTYAFKHDFSSLRVCKQRI